MTEPKGPAEDELREHPAEEAEGEDADEVAHDVPREHAEEPAEG